MVATKKSESRKSTAKGCLKFIESLLNTINHILIGSIAIYFTWFVFRQELTTKLLHAWLCIFGFQFLVPEGFLVVYPENAWSTHVPSKWKKVLHWMLILMGTALGVAGMALFIVRPREHFTSVHGKLGLACLIIMICNIALGLCNLFPMTFKAYVQPVRIRAVHNFLGISGFVVSLVCLYYGYDHFQRNISGDVLYLFQIFTIVTILLTSIGALKSLCRQLNLFSE